MLAAKMIGWSLEQWLNMLNKGEISLEGGRYLGGAKHQETECTLRERTTDVEYYTIHVERIMN